MSFEFWNQVGITSGVALIFWFVYESLWRLYLSPLSKFPGPKLASWTLWYEFYFDVVRDGGGQYVWEIERMHEKYGSLGHI